MVERNGLKIDTALNEVFYGNKREKLEQKQIDLLLFLLDTPNKLVTKEDIHSTVWNRTIVTDSALSRNIGAIRRMFQNLSISHLSLKVKMKKGYILYAEPLENDNAHIGMPSEASKTHSTNTKDTGNLYRLLSILFIAIVSVVFFSGLFNPVGSRIISLPITTASATIEHVSNSNIELGKEKAYVAYIQYDNGLSYFANSQGYSTIVREGNKIEKYKVKGWVKDFVFMPEYLVVHKIFKDQCHIQLFSLNNKDNETNLLCQNSPGSSALTQLSDNELLFSDGKDASNNLYTIDVENATIRFTHATPKHVQDIYNISLSPNSDKLAFLALTDEGKVSLFIGDFNSASEYTEVGLDNPPKNLQWLDNTFVAYIDTRNSVLTAHSYDEENIKYYSLGKEKLTGFYSTNNDEILFSHIQGSMKTYTVTNFNGLVKATFTFATELKRVSFVNGFIYFVSATDGVDNVWARNNESTNQSTFYDKAVKIKDVEIKEGVVIVATENSLDFWSGGNLKNSYPYSIDRIIDSASPMNPYVLKNSNLLRLNDNGITVHARKVSSAYEYNDQIWLTYEDREGLFILSNDKLSLHSNKSCSGKFARIQYVDEDSLYCTLRDGTESLFQLNLRKNKEESVSTNGVVIDINNDDVFVRTDNDEVIHLGLAKTPF